MICIFVELLVKIAVLMWRFLRIRLCLNPMGESHRGCWSKSVTELERVPVWWLTDASTEGPFKGHFKN